MIQPFVIYSFLFLLIVGISLPSDGNHGLLAPKSLAFFSAAFFFSLYFLTKVQIRASQAWGALFIWISLFFFGLWYLVGIDQDPQIKSGQFDQFKIFMTTLFTPFAGWYLVKEKLLSFEKIIRTVIYTNCAYNLVKISLMTLHVFGFINVWDVMHKTDLRFMSMHITGNIGRIQTSVDIITPFLLYFLLQGNSLGLNFSPRFKWFYALTAGCSVFLSFSRFLLFAFFLSLFLHACTLRYSKQIYYGCLGLIFCVMATLMIGPETVGEVIEKRFFSSDNAASDSTRNEQIQALMRACDESPLLGKGLGGYTPECIRDHQLPHAYEVQWMAFLMQFGFIGIVFLLMPLALIGWNFLSFPFSRPKLGFLILFALWIFSGFTNPFMISLTSGIIYTLFLLAGDRIKSTLR